MRLGLELETSGLLGGHLNYQAGSAVIELCQVTVSHCKGISRFLQIKLIFQSL